MPIIQIELTEEEEKLLIEQSNSMYDSLIELIGIDESRKLINDSFEETFSIREKFILFIKRLLRMKNYKFSFGQKITNFYILTLITKELHDKINNK